MNAALVDKIVQAVLYEGYVLYPYRPTSVKNRHRWTFGGIYPKSYSDGTAGSEPWMMQVQCLLCGHDPIVCATVRFLHVTNRTTLPEGQTWQEAVERKIEIEPMRLMDLLEDSALPPIREGEAPVRLSSTLRLRPEGSSPKSAEPRPTRRSRLGGSLALPPNQRKSATEFSFPHQQTSEERSDAPGSVLREQHAIAGAIVVSAERKSQDLSAVTIRIENHTAEESTSPVDRDAASLQSFASTHVILGATAGEFISLTDPPAPLAAIVKQCKNVGCWPVLVGNPGERDTMLASPIILSDYPEVAAESPGDLFDATEIDEILSLRIMTLTDEEKRQAAATDDRVRAMLARTDAMARDQLMSLHGTFRGMRPVRDPFSGPACGPSAPVASGSEPHSQSEQRHA